MSVWHEFLNYISGFLHIPLSVVSYMRIPEMRADHSSDLYTYALNLTCERSCDACGTCVHIKPWVCNWCYILILLLCIVSQTCVSFSHMHVHNSRPIVAAVTVTFSSILCVHIETCMRMIWSSSMEVAPISFLAKLCARNKWYACVHDQVSVLGVILLAYALTHDVHILHRCVCI